MEITLKDNLTDLKPEDLISYDREELIEGIIAQGVDPITIVVEGTNKLKFYFESIKILSLEQKLLSSEPIMVDWHLITKAREMWRNALVMAKAKSYAASK